MLFRSVSAHFSPSADTVAFYHTLPRLKSQFPHCTVERSFFAKIAARWRCGPPHLCCARYPAQPDPFSPSNGGAEPPLCPDVPASRSASSFPLVQRPVGYVQSPALWCERQSVIVCVSPLPHNLYMACTCPGDASCHRALYPVSYTHLTPNAKDVDTPFAFC